MSVFRITGYNNLRIFFSLSMIYWNENYWEGAGVEGMAGRAMIGSLIDTGGDEITDVL